MHLDFSHNNLGKEECNLMNKGLKMNQTVLGIHMIGNKLDTDAKGFIKSE